MNRSVGPAVCLGEQSSMQLNDDQIETQRVAGDITLVLKNGTDAERQSLLRAIEQACGSEERQRLENWIADGMPNA